MMGGRKRAQMHHHIVWMDQVLAAAIESRRVHAGTKSTCEGGGEEEG